MLLVAVVSVLGSAIAYSIVSGVSAPTTSRVEWKRFWPVRCAVGRLPGRCGPSQSRAADAGVINQALGHYADHCATCHANDGSGDTDGRGLYPGFPTCARRTRSP